MLTFVGESVTIIHVVWFQPCRLPLRPTRVVLPTDRRKPSLLEAGGSALKDADTSVCESLKPGFSPCHRCNPSTSLANTIVTKRVMCAYCISYGYQTISHSPDRRLTLNSSGAIYHIE